MSIVLNLLTGVLSVKDVMAQEHLAWLKYAFLADVHAFLLVRDALYSNLN